MNYVFSGVMRAAIFWFCAGACAAVASAEEAVLRLRADAWMPYNGDPAEARPGYVVEIARAIFEPKGIKVDYRQMGWEDALKAARAGEIDGVIGANATEARGLLVPAEPIGLPRIALVVAKKNPWAFESLRSLDKVKLGAIEGYSYWDSLDAYIQAHAGPGVVLFGGEKPLVDGIAKLNSGEIDVLAESLSVFVWTAKKAGYAVTDFRIAYSHLAEPVYVAFAKNDAGARFARIFDEGLAELRTSGKLAPLLQRYGLTDWK